MASFSVDNCRRTSHSSSRRLSLTRTSDKVAAANAEAGMIAEQAVGQVRTVYSFVSESNFISAYANSLKRTIKLGAEAGLVKGIGIGCTFAVVYPCFALLYWYGGVLIRNGTVDAGSQAVIAIYAITIGGVGIGQSMPILTYFAKGKVAAYKLFEVINRDSKTNVVNDNAPTLNAVEGHIELRNIAFAYPSRPDIPVFKNLSLVISPGKTLAIVGSSGSGKSTIISLIERFYDPDAGEIFLDGHNIRKLSLKWLRGRIGLVNQEPALFATTIAANILYGRDDATQEEIEEAARSANAHSFIEKLPLGYQTQVGEKGVQLSGGQKQRVAIARAVLRNPAVLLLDEATSALDAGSEQVVQEALDCLKVRKTTIVVAHRLSTIRNANSIAVVQQGQIVERGTHQKLISKPDGVYSTLIRLQQGVASQENSGVCIIEEESSTRLNQGELLPTGLKLHNGSPKEDKVTIDSSLIQSESRKPHGSFTRLIALCKPEWRYAVGGGLGSILAGCQTPAYAFIIAEVVTVYYGPRSKIKADVEKYAIILVAIGASSLVIFTLQHYCIGVLGENLVMRVKQRMFGRILQNELGWFDRDENNSGQILARLSSDATNLSSAFGDRAAMILQNNALVIVAWIVSLVLQWKLSLVIISVVPVLVISFSVGKLFLQGYSGDLNKAYARATQVAGEAVANIRTVVAFNAEGKVLALFEGELKSPAINCFFRGQIAGFGLGLSQILLFASFSLGLWYAGQTMFKDGAAFGNVFKVFLVLVLSSLSIAETLSLAPDLVKGGLAVASVFKMLDRRTAIEPDDPKGEQAEQIAGDIELQDVTFAYPSRPDVVIFKDLNLKVPAGDSLALVGASGSGKSTVIALIERFYDPVLGKILIDGKDIKQYNLRSVRQHIALVSQEPVLFATSINENILYGKNGATEAEVIEAAKAANAHNFISSLPDGYQTQVGERGVKLSGGQKQRVAIARAVLKDPAILLLDEATSALDAESESIVQEALNQLMKGRTTIVIAHRLSTIRGANTVAVVQQGTIVEKGSHADLLARNGKYASLLNIQNRHDQS